MPYRPEERERLPAKAKARARWVLRDAVAMTSPDALRLVFEQGVTREVAHMLERGALAPAITAFEQAAAEIHHALSRHGGSPCMACGEEIVARSELTVSRTTRSV